jgi:hypothetical protein
MLRLSVRAPRWSAHMTTSARVLFAHSSLSAGGRVSRIESARLGPHHASQTSTLSLDNDRSKIRMQRQGLFNGRSTPWTAGCLGWTKALRVQPPNYRPDSAACVYMCVCVCVCVYVRLRVRRW